MKAHQWLNPINKETCIFGYQTATMRATFKKSIILLFTLGSTLLNAQTGIQEENKVSSRIEKVVVYTQGAKLESKGSTTLKTGIQTLVFNGLSAQIDASSIEVKSNADILVYGTSFRLDYLNVKESDAFKKLNDSLLFERTQLAKLTISKRAYEEEFAVMQANRLVSGENSGLSTTELEKMVNFVRTRMVDIGLKKLEIEEKEKKQNERIARIERQIAEISNKGSKALGEIVVELSAAQSGNATFELSYFVTNCGWHPTYDVRVNEVGAQMEIAAKAKVFQQTGQDWKNVRLSISTGNPSKGSTSPVLNPWTLYFLPENQPKPAPMMRSSRAMDSGAPASLSEIEVSSSKRLKQEDISNYTKLNDEVPVNALFEINLPYSIKGDGKEVLVDIQKYKVDATYSYFTIPKIETEAFLVASFVNESRPELMPGMANVYFERNYVGQSMLNMQSSDDTLRFSLGRDNAVRIERKQLSDFSEKASISGATKRVNRSYEITVKNNRKQAIEIDIEDQIPLTSSDEISIEGIKHEGASLEKETGKLKWKVTLQSGATTKLPFSYAVKYPRKKKINGF